MDALAYASEHTIRAILTALCDDSRVYDKALGYLDRLEPEAKIKARSAMSQENTKKRKLASTLSICVQCDETFYEGSTEKCRYHYGKLEPDFDSNFWADHDENCHGLIDTDGMREMYPEGFVWTCCEKLGSEPGCHSGLHESNPEKSKRGRYESPSEDDASSEVSDVDDDNEEEGGEEDEEEQRDDDDV